MSRNRMRRRHGARYFDERESFALVGRDVTALGPMPGIPEGATGRVVQREKSMALDNNGWELGVEVNINPQTRTKAVDWVDRDEFFKNFAVR